MSTEAERAAIEHLIQRVALRDRAAFDRLYALSSAKLLGICLRVLKNRAEAEEAMQEVFVKIWLKADRFAVTGQSPMSWLIAIARHHAIDVLRQKRETVAELDDKALQVRDTAPGPEAQTVAAAERRRLDGCLDQLEPDRAAAVRSAYMEGDSYAELADRHAVPLNTMRTWLRRSLMRLKECLET
jgi:RNA polymerase sigma-70 factor (ECF subfamily)